MQLVFVHYHLNRGGVTRVMENQLRALATLHTDQLPRKVTIAYGGRAAAWNHEITKTLPFEVKLAAIPELDYDNESSSSAGQLDAIQELLAESGCATDSTVLHVHNHGLGKNWALPKTLGRLANDGWRLLLQIHDFAEDLRPTNYKNLLAHFDSLNQLHCQLYPRAPQVHYAVLNQRDHAVLAEAGIQGAQLHLLPNAVNAAQRPATREQTRAARSKLADIYGVPHQRRYLLYPVRAIRRKNLGEFLLWSMLAEDAVFAVTLAPLNPQELPAYRAWKSLAENLELPVLFGVGDESGLTLDENYAAADAVVTTSVAEGFGLVYLEATLAGRLLVGRSLPGITDDFRSVGMRFPGLADELQIPIDWIDVQDLKRTYLELSLRLRTSFGLPPNQTEALRGAIDAYFASDTVDFGRLDSKTQRMIVTQVRGNEHLQRTLRVLNPVVTRLRDADKQDLQRSLDENRRVIERSYSLNVIGTKLSQVYESVLSSKPERLQGQASIAKSILDSFVRPSRLFPIRLES